MTIQDALVRYRTEPRFAEFVDYLTGVVASGSFSGSELAAAASLAVDMAEARRLSIPGRAVVAAPAPESYAGP